MAAKPALVRQVGVLLKKHGWDIEYFKGFVLGLVWLDSGGESLNLRIGLILHTDLTRDRFWWIPWCGAEIENAYLPGDGFVWATWGWARRRAPRRRGRAPGFPVAHPVSACVRTSARAATAS